MRSRNRLLLDKVDDDSWLSSPGNHGSRNVKISQIRENSLNILNEGLADFTSSFTQPSLSISGKLEDLLASIPHEQVLAF